MSHRGQGFVPPTPEDYWRLGYLAPIHEAADMYMADTDWMDESGDWWTIAVASDGTAYTYYAGGDCIPRPLTAWDVA